jgi:hypothetical protein
MLLCFAHRYPTHLNVLSLTNVTILNVEHKFWVEISVILSILSPIHPGSKYFPCCYFQILGKWFVYKNLCLLQRGWFHMANMEKGSDHAYWTIICLNSPGSTKATEIARFKSDTAPRETRPFTALWTCYYSSTWFQCLFLFRSGT